MTLLEKWIAIAQACKWKIANPNNDRADYRTWIPPGKKAKLNHMYFDKPPDYFHDLNAMHEALSVLTDMQWHDYEHRLRDICDGMSSVEGAGRELLHSTASQQAEAFGKTLNLW
jgi:hypothetical protein